jgi:hypothetical protein
MDANVASGRWHCVWLHRLLHPNFPPNHKHPNAAIPSQRLHAARDRVSARGQRVADEAASSAQFCGRTVGYRFVLFRYFSSRNREKIVIRCVLLIVAVSLWQANQFVWQKLYQADGKLMHTLKKLKC